MGYIYVVRSIHGIIYSEDAEGPYSRSSTPELASFEPPLLLYGCDDGLDGKRGEGGRAGRRQQ
jgi:hypothetical protein